MPEDFAFKEIMIWGYNLIFKITINNTIQDVYNSIQLGTSKTLLSQDSTALLKRRAFRCVHCLLIQANKAKPKFVEF